MLFVLVFVLWSCCFGDGASVWPTPNKIEVTSPGKQLALDPQTFQMIFSREAGCSAGDVPPFPSAIARYFLLTFWYPNATKTLPTGVATLPTLEFCILSAQTVPTFQMDEGYQLNITETGASLRAQTMFGAMRGLETFAQLVDLTKENYWAIEETPIHITDKPYKPWRGFMLDTARRYYPKDLLYKLLDSMAWAKMNVFHWHLVDAEAFPYQVSAYSKLSGAGAYHSTAVYSKQDVADVVYYANIRGIRVIPEFDNPGHTGAWGKGYPITTNCPKYFHNVDNINLTPVSPLTLPVLQAVIDQASTDFADPFIHLGGDEVVQGCWREDPKVVSWMKAHNMNSTTDLYQWFVTQSTSMATKNKKTTIHWQEVWDNRLTLPKGSVIQVWKIAENLPAIIAAGYKVILSATTDTQFYMSKQRPNPKDSVWGFQQTWMDFYNTEVPNTEQVYGIEGTQWGEFVNAGSVLQNIWVRAAVLSELSWTEPANKPKFNKFVIQPMLNQFSCTLRRRGVPASTVTPGYCFGAQA